MNLRHYLRGLGIGVLVTAFILGITGKEEKLTDAQIKLRAKELGMVEETVLSEIYDSQDKIPENEAGTDSKENSVSDEPSSKTDRQENVGSESGNNTTEENLEEESIIIQETPEMNKSTDYYIVVTIEKGNSSAEVSKKLYEAGLIVSADEYDSFLTTNGYDRRLSAGEHKIPLDADEETIAKILCSME